MLKQLSPNELATAVEDQSADTGHLEFPADVCTFTFLLCG